MAKGARLSREEVIENWESFMVDVDEWEELDNVQEPVMPGSDDEFSELEDNLVEEEEEEVEYREGDETECVQKEVNSVQGTERTDNTSNTTEDTVPPLNPRKYVGNQSLVSFLQYIHSLHTLGQLPPFLIVILMHFC